MSQDVPSEQDRSLSPKAAGTSMSTNKVPTNTSKYSVQDDMEKGSSRTNLDDHLDVYDSAQPKADLNIIDWDGPNDAANPQNWSKGMRIGHVALISIITLIA